MAKKRRKRTRRKKSPLIRIFATIAVVSAVVFLCSKAAFQCDHCGKLTFGAGYKPNLLIEAFGKEERICETCAKEEHKEMIALGQKTVYSYKLDIDWFGKNKADKSES